MGWDGMGWDGIKRGEVNGDEIRAQSLPRKRRQSNPLNFCCFGVEVVKAIYLGI